MPPYQRPLSRCSLSESSFACINWYKKSTMVYVVLGSIFSRKATAPTLPAFSSNGKNIPSLLNEPKISDI